MDSHLKKLQQALNEATAGMSAEERSWHPPGKWCVDEVLEHLYLTYTGTIRGFPRALGGGSPPGGGVRKFCGGGIMGDPILGPLTAGQWRKFHLVHGMHHVKQIRRLRGEQG